MTTASTSSTGFVVLRSKALAVAAAAALAAASITATASAAGAADGDVVYSSQPVTAPASYPSIGFNARSTLAVGDLVELGGTARMLEAVEVSFNSWACETGTWNSGCDTDPAGGSFSHPITATVYAVTGTGASAAPGAVLAEVTQDVDVPFRPAPNEAECGAGSTAWHDAALDTCQNGFSFPIEFDFTSAGVRLPEQVIVAFSTLTSKNSSLPAGPYDSLNIDLGNAGASVGTDVDADAFLIDAYANVGYLDGGAGGLNTLRQDFGWTGYEPVFAIYATAVPDLTSSVIDFETASDVASADGGLSGATIVEGADAMAAAAGCFFATAPVVEYSADVFTRYSGYSSVFPDGGYTASADFYLGTTADAGQFSWSHAVNGADGNHQRDFIFHADSDGAGNWTVGVSNNVVTTPPFITTYPTTPVAISEEGWYTFQHTIREDAGLLYVDLAVLDANGVELESWTLGGNAADQVPSAVGGNRYGWLVNNAFDGLAIDNVLLNAERPTGACVVAEPDTTPDTESDAVADADAAIPVTAEPTYAG
ncbi:hypothetical protein [uncultured Demequina sp.]|uniref:hypothetical protein n=1 Tax=uncultured Demequina sp. TaxID=693499 RepID=UPI0025D21A7D|nr:hypothetical protein [uncultured Demequina sp.]